MPNTDELKAELDDALTLKMISQAFTEAAAAKLAKIRSSFEKNKQFYDEIGHLYRLVQTNANKAHVKEKEAKAEGKRDLAVAITSNQRFYGNINVSIMRKFVDDVKKQDIDVMVMGNTGRDFMKTAEFGRAHEERFFAKDYPSDEESRSFLDYIKPYKSVYLYYPKFMSLVRQEVGIIDITEISTDDQKVSDEEVNVLFEPELSMIYDFFATQIRSLLFLRVMLESDLARTAARLLTMSGAEERSNDTIKEKKLQLRKIQLSVLNAKLLETFSAMVGVKK
jgi:ATP synthase F1 gamma subunit